MANYTVNGDLFEVRPQLEAQNESFKDQHDESTRVINRTLESKWYFGDAKGRGIDPRVVRFNPDLMLDSATEIKKLATFLAIKLIYERFITGFDDEVNQLLMQMYENRYKEELELVLDLGISYDWDDSGTIDNGEEINEPQVRTLHRI